MQWSTCLDFWDIWISTVTPIKNLGMRIRQSQVRFRLEGSWDQGFKLSVPTSLRLILKTQTPQPLPKKVVFDVPQTPQPLPQENSVCVFNKHGFCKTHRLLGFTREITVYKWEDRGGGLGFGNVRRKVKKFICPAKSKAPTGPSISTWINSANQKSSARPTEEGKFEFYTPVSDQNILAAF